MSSAADQTGGGGSLAELSSCALDLDGLTAQRDRYAAIGRTVTDLARSPRWFSATLSAAADVALIEETLRIERECCPFFELDFDPRRRRLRVGVDSEEMAPALEAIYEALARDSSPDAARSAPSSAG